MPPAAPVNGHPTSTLSDGRKDHADGDPKQPQPRREHFNTSDLYSLEIINATLAHQPLEATQARKPLLAAKVYLESSKIDRDSPFEATLDLCEARLELVACHLHEKEISLAESEALQVLSTCKKLSKLTRTRYSSDDTAEAPPSWDRDTVVCCVKLQIRALDYLHDIDEERGISARAARWRETQTRLQERLQSPGT